MQAIVKIAVVVCIVVLTGLFIAAALIATLGNAMLRMVTGGAVKPLTHLERH
jgi:hypothetical protein